MKTRDIDTGFYYHLWKKTLRLREVELLVQVHTAGEWQSWDLNSGHLASQALYYHDYLTTYSVQKLPVKILILI